MQGTHTPINNGNTLSQLDIKNKGIQFEILSYDKHQTLEGLQIEPLAMTYIKHLEKLGLEIPDVTTVISRQKGWNNARCFFVWDRSRDEVSEGYIEKLRLLAPNTTYAVTYHEGEADFYCHKPKQPEKTFPLQAYLREKRGKNGITFPNIKQNVRDTERQMAVFWGRLHGAFDSEESFRNEVLLNRILKNFVVQPFFTWLWDLDRIVRYRKQYWEIELKHKYPFQRGERAPLKFGINVGQARLIKDLGQAGVRTLHLILVKPNWNKNTDPGYLFNRRDISDKVLLIGTELTTEKSKELLKQTARESDETTSYTGGSKNHFLEIPASDFFLLGSYQTPPEEVAKNIKRLMDGDALEKVTDNLLKTCKTS